MTHLKNVLDTFVHVWVETTHIAAIVAMLMEGAISRDGYAHVLRTPDAITITVLHECMNTLSDFYHV